MINDTGIEFENSSGFTLGAVRIWIYGYMDQELVHYIYIWVQVDGFMIGKIFNISHIYVQTKQHYRIYFLLAG